MYVTVSWTVSLYVEMLSLEGLWWCIGKQPDLKMTISWTVHFQILPTCKMFNLSDWWIPMGVVGCNFNMLAVRTANRSARWLTFWNWYPNMESVQYFPLKEELQSFYFVKPSQSWICHHLVSDPYMVKQSIGHGIDQMHCGGAQATQKTQRSFCWLSLSALKSSQFLLSYVLWGSLLS